MISDEGSGKSFLIEQALSSFSVKLPSSLAHHGARCCEVAVRWFSMMHYAHAPQKGEPYVPTWLGERYTWGPSIWPLFWCEAVSSRELDCGALAAMARCALQVHGVDAVPAALVRVHAPQEVAQWRTRWREASALDDWICGEFVYHEVVAILGSRDIRVWDPSDSSWVQSPLSFALGGACAMRVPGSLPTSHLAWGDQVVVPGRWLCACDAPTGQGGGARGC